ncbi:Gfo/Idh/MocA family oxidoreductase [Pseudogracilibacillus sp. SO30301A]|uniref:Gfo/Idh/MocA family oxidoreductase n=1 Tax=Pseudogracilibacillus sp. SO30301A TaxID=3098291 RepID=UPI00300E3257
MVFKIGLIGLDTSHVEIFTKLLYEDKSNFYCNIKIVIGYPCPSPDLTLSKTRVDEYTSVLNKEYGVEIAKSIEEVAEKSDAIFITAMDGRKHLDIFKKLLPYKIPVFIDKPLTITENDAKEIFTWSETYNTPVMSSSALRYSDSLTTLLQNEKEKPTSVYLNGPLPFIEHIPYYSWYGIHMVEMLFTVFGSNYTQLSVQGNEHNDVITAEWEDGQFGVIRGVHVWHSKFEALFHYPTRTVHLPIYKDKKSYYALLLKKIITFCKTGQSPIPKEETLSIIRFIEEANAKRAKLIM